MRARFAGIVACLLVLQLLMLVDPLALILHHRDEVDVPFDHQEITARCRTLDRTPLPPPGFHQRAASDRVVPGTPPTLIKNARIWTGSKDGTEVVHGDVFIDDGIIKGVGHFGRHYEEELKLNGKKDLVVIDAKGSWLTPGFAVI
jgi:hypothetical protein